MHPNFLVGALASYSMFGIGMLKPARPQTKTERMLDRLDRAEALYRNKMASPAYHAAEAKRARKRMRRAALKEERGNG